MVSQFFQLDRLVVEGGKSVSYFLVWTTVEFLSYAILSCKSAKTIGVSILLGISTADTHSGQARRKEERHSTTERYCVSIEN